MFQNESFVIWGDRPEYIVYVDYYNNLDSQNRGVFRYKENILPDHIERNDAPDIIIARNIAYHSAKRAMRTIPRSIINGGGEKELFYNNLLAAGTIGRNQNLVPISFNVPIIVFDRTQPPPEFVISSTFTLDQLRRGGEQLNLYNEEVLSRVGFSPQWDAGFLYLGTKIYGANYREDRQGNIRWDEEEIFDALRYFRGWNSEIASDELERFIVRYIREPLDKRLADQRIGFFVDNIVNYSKLDAGQFDFRPIANATGVFIDEDMTFIGIHKYGKSNTQAQNFIRWLLQQETQAALIAHTHAYGTDLFGFANGLSTLKDISVRIIPQYYPWLIGSIPNISNTPTPAYPPKYWNRIRDEVVRPWLQNFLNDIDQESIENEITKWRKREEFR